MTAACRSTDDSMQDSRHGLARGGDGWGVSALALAIVALAGCGGDERAATAPSDVPPDTPADAAPDSGSEELSGSPAADGFESLFNGRDLTGFELVAIDTNTLSVVDGVLKCTGVPNGYFYPPGIYRNFVLRLDFQFARPADLAPGADATFGGNSGWFMYVEPPHQVWPRSLEVQGLANDFSGVYTLPEFLPVDFTIDQQALSAARRPIGDWNHLQITSNEGALEIALNGRVIDRSQPTDLVEGQIAFESEGAEIHFREIWIKRLP
jgi:hypothetical protein